MIVPARYDTMSNGCISTLNFCSSSLSLMIVDQKKSMRWPIRPIRLRS
jgi:hypothetical protein